MMKRKYVLIAFSVLALSGMLPCLSHQENRQFDTSVFIPTFIVDSVIREHQYEGLDSDIYRYVEIKDGIKEIPQWAFAIMPSMNGVLLGMNVHKIDDNAFFSCKNLQSVNLSRIDSIGENAFKLTGLNTIDLRNAKYIGEFAFADCCNLKNIRFSQHLRSVDSFAFKGDSILESIRIPSGQIQEGSFMGCVNLKQVYLKNVISIGEAAFLDCRELTSVVLPKRLDSIAAMSFMNCKGLTTIKFPKGLKKIGEYSFYSTGLRELVVPKTVTEIGPYAFADCKNLERVIIQTSNINISNTAFDNNKIIIFNSKL